MSEEATQLIGCPFCGSNLVELTRETPSAYFIVSCAYCGAQGPDAKEKTDAIKAWNTRKSPNL